MMRFRPLHFAAPAARHAGFSLIELAIAVLIASILLTMGLAAFSVQVEATALSATQKRQDTIKEALIAYLRTHKRLRLLTKPPHVGGFVFESWACSNRLPRTSTVWKWSPSKSWFRRITCFA